MADYYFTLFKHLSRKIYLDLGLPHAPSAELFNKDINMSDTCKSKPDHSLMIYILQIIKR